MYSLVSAIGKSFASDGRWENIDISAMKMREIYATYIKVIAVLSNPFLQTPTKQVSLDLTNIRTTAGSLDITFSEYLVQNGNKTLATSDRLPTLSTKYARWNDAFRAGYKVQPVNPNTAPDANLPTGDKEWLYLSRPNTDFNLFGKSCLVSINGFFHRTDYDATGAWVIDGMKSRNKSGDNKIGLLSFRELGSIRCKSITADMVYKQDPSHRLRDRAYIDVGEDISNMTVMLVIGGYLHLLDPKTFFRVGTNLLAIDFNNYPMFERYHESLPWLDYSSLVIERTDNPTQFSPDDFLTDANITALLTMSQSFIVLLDNSEIFTETEVVKKTKNPNMLISYKTEPKYPLFNGHGKLAEYFCIRDPGWRYSLRVLDNTWHHRLYNTTNPHKQISIADNRVPGQVTQQSHAFFLKIGTSI